MDLAWPPPLCEKNPHFSVAKATLESLMSLEGVVILNLGCGYIEKGVVISVWNQNPSASQNQANLPLCLTIDLSDTYQPSCQSANIPFLFAKVTLESQMSVS